MRHSSVEKVLGDTLLFAEVKPRSPFPAPQGWQSEQSWEELFEIADEYGDWVAVHTEDPWGGSLELLEQARGRTEKPLLAKGLHEDDRSVEAALAAGADAVLIVGRLPKVHRDQCIIEPSNLYELRSLALSGLRLAWNSRDLQTGGHKTDPTTGQPLAFECARTVLPDSWLCQASFIRSAEDVHPAADAVLIGSHLPEFVETL